MACKISFVVDLAAGAPPPLMMNEQSPHTPHTLASTTRRRLIETARFAASCACRKKEDCALSHVSPFFFCRPDQTLLLLLCWRTDGRGTPPPLPLLSLQPSFQISVARARRGQTADSTSCMQQLRDQQGRRFDDRSCCCYV